MARKTFKDIVSEVKSSSSSRRERDIERYGNQYRNGGAKPWTQENKKAKRNKYRCRESQVIYDPSENREHQ